MGLEMSSGLELGKTSTQMRSETSPQARESGQTICFGCTGLLLGAGVGPGGNYDSQLSNLMQVLFWAPLNSSS